MFDFTGRVVVVTGAAGNLGTVVARAFRQAGARLVLFDHALDRLQRLFPELAGSSEHYLAAGVDLTDASAVMTIAGEVTSRLGRIDALINTVGGYRGGIPLAEMRIDDWDFMQTMNARTTFIATRAFAPQMLRQGSGHIVNVASRAALAGEAGASAYSAAKSAVVRLTESLSAELKHDGINVNCVLPGLLNTPQNREALPDLDQRAWVDPEMVADVILFLASAHARGIHGAAIPVFGQG
ncbi:MAG: SDR family NAD(P)-dependent oxidoreductase [Blastocatellia bacterium]